MKKHMPVILLFLIISLFAEKVSFKEIKNVAINYYRQNIAFNQFEKGIISDYEKALNPDNFGFDLDSVVYKNVTIEYIFNIKPTGFLHVRTANANFPVGYWKEEGSNKVDHTPPKPPEPGALVPITRNHTYDAYYNKPSKWSLELWDKYKIDPKSFNLIKKFKAKRAGLGESTNIAINFYRDELVKMILGNSSIDDYKEAIDLKNIKFKLDSLTHDETILCYFYDFFPDGSIVISPYYNQCPIYSISFKAVSLPSDTDEEKRKSTMKMLYDRNLYCLPYPKATWQWNKYNIDPKEFQITKEGSDVAPVNPKIDSKDKKE